MQNRSTRLIASLLLVAAVVVSAGAGPAAGQESPPPQPPPTIPEDAGVVHSWALAPGDGSQEGDRTNMFFDLPPGGEAQDAVTLFNFSNVKLVFTIYATDAFNNVDGEFDLLPGGEQPVDVGSWVSIPQREVAVEPRQQVTFPVTIKVPLDATPGDHAGAILAASTALGTGPDGKVINLDRRTGSRVYVRVAGALTPRLTVEEVRTRYEPALNPLGGRAEVTYRIENRGNVRLGGTHHVSVAGPFGLLGRRSKAIPLPELLPGEGVTLTETLRDVAATGLAIADVEITPTPATGEADAPTASRGRSLELAVPLALVAVVLACGLLAYARRSFLRHRGEQVVAVQRLP